MGADLYMMSRGHAEDNYWPLMSIVKEAIRLLDSGESEAALELLKEKHREYDFYANW